MASLTGGCQEYQFCVMSPSQGVLGNKGTMTKYLREQGNINNFRDQRAGNKFESNFGNKGTQANF